MSAIASILREQLRCYVAAIGNSGKAGENEKMVRLWLLPRTLTDQENQVSTKNEFDD
jgi:hypothetical protein